MFRTKLQSAVLLFFLILNNQSFSQKLEDDLKAIGKSLDSASSIVIVAKVDVYNRKGGSLIFKTDASIKRSGKASITVMADQECYSNESYLMSIDHEEKKVEVLARKNDKQDQSQKLNIDLKELEKLFEKQDQEDLPIAKLVSESNGNRTYVVTNVSGIKEIKISLNTTKGTLNSISYEYSETSEYKGQYILVTYSKFDKNTDVSTSLKQSNFFTLSNGKVTLNTRLKAYTLYTEL